MPLPAPLPASPPPSAGTSGKTDQTGSFLPEMETALDDVTSAPTSRGAFSSLETVPAGNASLDAAPAALFGHTLPSSLTSTLLKRSKSGFASYHSNAAKLPSGEPAALDGACSLSAELLESPSMSSAMAGPPVKQTGPPESDALPDAQTHHLAVAAPILPSPESAPPPAAFGLPFSDATSPDTLASDSEAAAMDMPRPAHPDPSLLSSTSASAQPVDVTGFQPGVRAVRHSGSSPSSSPRTKFAAVSQALPRLSADDGAAAAVATRFELSHEASTGSPVFEALITQPDPGKTSAVSSASSAPTHSKSQDRSIRPAPPAKPAASAIDTRAARSDPASAPGRVDLVPGAQNPDQPPHTRHFDSRAGAAASAAPLNPGIPGAAVLSDAAASYESPSADTSGSVMPIDEPQQAAEPGLPVHLPPVQDLDPAASPDALREVSLKLEGAGGAAVHLRFTERRGEVHVVTRTQDAGLGERLASDLPELRRAIEDSGMSADIWASSQEIAVPRESEPSRSDAGPNSGHQPGAFLRQGDSGGRRHGGHHDRWADQIEDALDGAQGAIK